MVTLFHEATLTERLARVSHFLELRTVPGTGSSSSKPDDSTPSNRNKTATLPSDDPIDKKSPKTQLEYRGLFATQDIPAGTILFNEVPLLYLSGKTQKKILFGSNVYSYLYKRSSFNSSAPKEAVSVSASVPTNLSVNLNPTDIMSNFTELEIQLPNLAYGNNGKTTNDPTLRWSLSTLLQALSSLQPLCTPSCTEASPNKLTLIHFAEIIKTNAAEAAFATFDQVQAALRDHGVPRRKQTVSSVMMTNTLMNNDDNPDDDDDDDHDPANGISCLLLLFSMFNHSCLPNVTWISRWSEEYRAPVFQLYTLRPIKKNDECKISYVSEKIYQKERKLDLYDRYKFTCDCLRCSVDFDDTQALVCFECCGTVYGNSTRCLACRTEWYRYIPLDPSRWEPDSLRPLVKLSKQWLEERQQRNAGKGKGEMMDTLSSIIVTDNTTAIPGLLSSFYNDILWFLEDEVNLQTLACASARLHPFDVRFVSILCRVRDDCIDYTIQRFLSNVSSSDSSVYGVRKSSVFSLLTLRTLWHISEVCVYSITRNVPCGIGGNNWHRPQEQLDALLANSDALVLYSIDRLHKDREKGTDNGGRNENHNDLPWTDFSVNSMAQDPVSLWRTVLNRYDRIIDLCTLYKGILWRQEKWFEFLQQCRKFIASLIPSSSADDDALQTTEWTERIQSTEFRKDIVERIQEWRQQRREFGGND